MTSKNTTSTMTAVLSDVDDAFAVAVVPRVAASSSPLAAAEPVAGAVSPPCARLPSKSVPSRTHVCSTRSQLHAASELDQHGRSAPMAVQRASAALVSRPQVCSSLSQLHAASESDQHARSVPMAAQRSLAARALVPLATPPPALADVAGEADVASEVDAVVVESKSAFASVTTAWISFAAGRPGLAKEAFWLANHGA